jgi:hypothetical protein
MKTKARTHTMIPERTVEVDSRTFDVEMRIVSCNRVTQTPEESLTKSFSFTEVIPYDLDPLQSTCFVELVFVETLSVTMREVLEVTDTTMTVRTTKGIVKKYNRGVHMLSLNGKRINLEQRLRRLKQPRNFDYL